MQLNPFAFRPGPVAFWTTAVYLAFLIPLIYIQETVPAAPRTAEPYAGLNLDQAWLDLDEITRKYHPFNSRNNDEVRDYLLRRIAEVLDASEVPWRSVDGVGKAAAPKLGMDMERTSSSRTVHAEGSTAHSSTSPEVVVFNDMISNLTMTTAIQQQGSGIHTQPCGLGTYFEGTNIAVYIRGTEDEPGDWWYGTPRSGTKPIGKGGVLVNAHYDSVSTAYGATDDGMGVVTVLQLIAYFVASGRQPKHGIVALLNNAEEDYLWGARAFAYSPLMPFCHAFLNLEGAGAGGRALLFRTTDQEVTEAYASSPHPFGSIIASDGFTMGLIRSQTDYVVFNGVYGARGLDVAFYEPRARYHTNQDDARHASRQSLWHMLSAAVATMEHLTGDTGDKFIGEPSEDGQVPNGQGTDGVWFDLFGSTFAVFALRGLFAWSLTLLVATPLVLMLLTCVLVQTDKYYFFTRRVQVHEDDDDSWVPLGGWRGFFRFPFAVAVAGALTMGSAFLVKKFNPMIIASSQYAVWAMMLSLFYTAFWTIMRGANAIRPSALHRGYVNIWLFALGWLALVGVTVFVDRFRLGFGYPVVIMQSAIFVSTAITLSELFGLAKRKAVAQIVYDTNQLRDSLEEISNSDALIAPSPGEMENTASVPEESSEEDDEAEPSETTPLRGASDIKHGTRTTFATTYRRTTSANTDGSVDSAKDRIATEPFENEQPWSTNLPSWTWLLQLLVLAPITLMIFGEVALFLTAALCGTGSDGGSTLTPYLLVALLSIILLLPITPFIHRVSWHIPAFLLAIFTGTLIYNLVAFPYSPNARYKAFFQQGVDLDTGANLVKISGLREFIGPIISELPSASGKNVTCEYLDPKWRPNLMQCVYDGEKVPPNLVKGHPKGVPPEKGYASLVTINATRPHPKINKATLEIDAKDTKACFLSFDKPLSGFEVKDGNEWDPRFGRFPDEGICQVKMWRRDWSKVWSVDIEWKDDVDDDAVGYDKDAPIQQERKNADSDELRRRRKSIRRQSDNSKASGIDGKVTCIWSDANEPGTIPALDEVLQFAPAWVAISKAAEGLVEGTKSFKV